jgi:hypothetical protein
MQLINGSELLAARSDAFHEFDAINHQIYDILGS